MNTAPYSTPTAEAQAANDQFLPPLLCSTPKATPAASTPLLRQANEISGNMHASYPATSNVEQRLPSTAC